MAWAQSTIDEWAARAGAPATALVLGATPELVDRRWSCGSRVFSVDRSFAMLDALRPEARPEGAVVAHVQGDWRHLPLAERSCDLVFGDGSLNVAPSWVAPELVQSVACTIRRGGRFALRAYVAPDVPDRPEEVWQRLIDRCLPSFHIFKFHLLMALRDRNSDVRVADAHRYFRSRCTDDPALAHHLGWPTANVRTIEAYADQPDVYWFPTLTELQAALGDRFEETTCRCPSYEMGERCPTLTLRACS